MTSARGHDDRKGRHYYTTASVCTSRIVKRDGRRGHDDRQGRHYYTTASQGAVSCIVVMTLAVIMLTAKI